MYPDKPDSMTMFTECMARIEQQIKSIAFSLDRQANASEATHNLYKKANEATKRAMEAREEREKEANERSKMDFSMSKERHEAFMRNQKATETREAEWLKKVKEVKNNEDKNIIESNTQ